jgi:hypothetical protein
MEAFAVLNSLANKKEKVKSAALNTFVVQR